MDRFTDDQPLRKELLGLADLHGLINCRHKHFFFRAVSSWAWLWAVSPFCRTGKS